MLGVLQGFGIVGLVIALGVVLAHTGVLDESAQRVLTKVSFWVATPALLVGLVADADLTRVFGVDFLVHLVAALATVAVAVPLWRLAFRSSAQGTVMGAVTAVYSNSVNLGLPIAVYALQDATAVIPLVVLQLAFLQPLALAALDLTTASGRITVRTLTRPLVNPLILATAVGALLSLTGTRLTTLLAEPLDLVGSMAVPAILLAFGISLRLGPRFGAGGSWVRVLAASGLKLVVMPAVAVAVGVWLFDVSGPTLLSVAVIATLPTAQNVFAMAASYDAEVDFTRDAIFATTVLSVPAVLVVTAVLG